MEENQLQIKEDNLTGKKIVELLQEHLENIKEIFPPQSVHALDLTALQSPEITFWTAWEDDELLGCGALKELDLNSGEIKSMRTAKSHLRKGVGSKILEQIIQEAKKRNYDFLYLETGSLPEFTPARTLYRKYGFEYRNPFGEYTEDVNNVFMQKNL